MKNQIQTIREHVIPKTTRDVTTALPDQQTGQQVARSASRVGVKLCLDRARLITESYKETEGDPLVIRQAKALVKILQNMTIYIDNGLSIVGNFAQSPDHVAWYPEVATEWLDYSLKTVHKGLLDERGEAELAEIHSYWKRNSVNRYFMNAVPKHLKKYIFFTGASLWGWHGRNPLVLDLERAFKLGISDMIKEVEQRLVDIENDFSIHAKDYLEQREFLQAVVIALKGCIDFAGRYAKLARDMVRETKNQSDKKRLLKIAEVCDWVPSNPPRSLHEALQFHWFLHLITNLIECSGSGSGIRFDVVYFPYYKRDVEEGRITREEAVDLMKMMFIKMEGAGFLSPPIEGSNQAGDSLFQTINIGGVDTEGKDITNEMTHIVLDAAKELKTRQPTIIMRFHSGTPTQLLEHAIDVISTGIGYPALINDKSAIPYLLNRGLTLEDARNYVIRGCVAWFLPGKNINPDSAISGHIILPKCLELALNRGIDKFTGQQLGYLTPDPETFQSIEDIMQAFLKQVNFFTEKQARISQLAQAVYNRYYPRPFSSAFIDGCIEQGKSCTAWRYHSYSFILPLGPNNVADALTAIKKLVFDEKKVSLKEIINAVNENWKGYEELRQLCLAAPKYGNDDDYADSIAVDVHFRVNEEIKKFPDYFGMPIYADGSAAATNYTLCEGTGATPDGRKDKEPFADAVLSPIAGKDVKGPTAVIKSASKIEMPKTYCLLFNQKFQPEFLQGEYKKMFVDYIRTVGDLGIYHIQFNVVDRATLIDAQEHPEKHPNLIVRVAGYSAYFQDLGKEMQDEVIKRTEQCLC